jgi:hypothetical protein
MSIYKEMQLVQIENEELRIRLKDLKNQVAEIEKKLEIPKYPSIVYHLQCIGNNARGGKTYQIIDECGYIQDSFEAESEKEAIEFFNLYKETKKKTKIMIIVSRLMDDVLVSLQQLEFQYIPTTELKLVTHNRYNVYVGKELVCIYDESATEQEALDTYANNAQEYIRNNQPNSITILM